MKLTNYMRDAFIRAAMNDVPQVDYQEQANKLAHKALDDQFHKVFPGVDRLKAGESSWLRQCGVDMPGSLKAVYTIAPHYSCLKKDEKTWAKLGEIAQKHGAQSQQRDDLERKLNAVAYSMTTRKALADALPEFAKYLPPDEPTATRMLPVVANVAAEFVKAGWPKGAKKAA